MYLSRLSLYRNQKVGLRPTKSSESASLEALNMRRLKVDVIVKLYKRSSKIRFQELQIENVQLR